jgi:hypothetical protein
MDDTERLIAALVAPVPSRPSDLMSRLKRSPNSLRWKFILAYWGLKREWTGIVHRLQSRQIVHFLHIGKTGGTAVKSALRGYETAGAYEIILHEHGFSLTDVPLGEKICFFVRDPIGRFTSGFHGRQRQDRPRFTVPWTAGETIAFGRFKTPNELALALSSDDKALQSAAVDAMRSIGHLKTPHWTWFKNERRFLSRVSDILFIGFQESLSEDFMMLKKILMLPEEARLPKDEIASHKSPGHLDKQLDEEAIRNLEIWYARDYRFLELCREISARIRRDYERRFPETKQCDSTGIAETARSSALG